MSIRRLALGVIVIFATAASAAAQAPASPSLGEVARQAEAAKPTVKKATKTYTNATLAADPNPPPPPVAAAPESGPFVSKTLDKPVSAEEVIARSEAKVAQDAIKPESEERWRSQAETIRMELAQTQASYTRLNRPNEARANNPAAQARHDAELAKFAPSFDILRKKWAALEDAARAKKIASAWLDPRPQFPAR